MMTPPRLLMNTCWERIEEFNRLARSREVCAGLCSELELHQSWEKKFEDNIEKEIDKINPCTDLSSNMLFKGGFVRCPVSRKCLM